MKKYIINASGKKLGRVASEAASIMMGKRTPEVVRNRIPDVSVSIENAKDLDLSERRLSSILHKSYSGYPGGLTINKGKEILSKHGPKKLLEHAIMKMIPRNKLHKERMKRINISE